MKATHRRAIMDIMAQAAEAARQAGGAGAAPRGGWLRAVREAGEVSQSELAAKLGFKRQAWAQFEASEARGAISLASLRRAADALGCEMAYFVYPKAKRLKPRVAAVAADGVAARSVEGVSGEAAAAAAQPAVGQAAGAGWVESPTLPTELL